jgi:hypothetical protein
MGILKLLIEFLFVRFNFSLNFDYLIGDVIVESVNRGLSFGRSIDYFLAKFGSGLVCLIHILLSFEKLKLRNVNTVLIVGVEDIYIEL